MLKRNQHGQIVYNVMQEEDNVPGMLRKLPEVGLIDLET